MSAGPTTPRHVTFEARATGPATRSPVQATTQRTAAPAIRVRATTGAAPAATTPAVPQGSSPFPSWRMHADLMVAAALIVVAAGARLLPAGTTRIMLTLPVLLVVPGYLLLQAMRSRVAEHRIQDVLIGIGLSLPVLGLAALLTSVVPNGFTPTAIVTVTTVVCVALAVTAVLRRNADPVAA